MEKEGVYIIQYHNQSFILACSGLGSELGSGLIHKILFLY